MSSSQKKDKVHVDLGARAEAKLEVQATVPERSVGRLVDAITDAFRPFSEARGLRADQIRLQREDVAIEIAKKAKERLAIENVQAHPISNKILIPLIEAASNEEIDDSYMIGMWANLLASAATHDRVEPRFVGILKEIQGAQAKAFEVLALNKMEEFELPWTELEETPLSLETADIRQFFVQYFGTADEPPEIDEIYKKLRGMVDRPGSIPVDIIVQLGNGWWSLKCENNLSSKLALEYNLEILESLGLCRHVTEFYESKFGHEIIAIYFAITNLGVHFFLACKDLKSRREIPS